MSRSFKRRIQPVKPGVQNYNFSLRPTLLCVPEFLLDFVSGHRVSLVKIDQHSAYH